MVSHKHYNPSASEGFVILLTSKLITCLLTSSLRKQNPNQLLIYSMEVSIYIEFWTLEMKCTQYGLYGQATFKNASAI
jgi:hypothetical protein